MFNRLAVEISTLPRKQQINILRQMIEGDLTFQTVAQAAGKIKRLQQHASQISDFVNSVDAFTSRTDMILGNANNPANQLLKEYCELPFSQRIEKTEEYQNKILRHAGVNDRVAREFEKIKDKDISPQQAIYMLVEIFLLNIAQIPNVQTDTLVSLFKSLINNTDKVFKSNNAQLDETVKEFQLACDTLKHSYCLADKRQHIDFVVTRVLELEAQYRVPLMETTRYLYNLQAQLSKPQQFKDKKFLMFGEKPVKAIGELRALLKHLPDPFVPLAEDAEKQAGRIRDIFSTARSIISNEQGTKLGRPKDVTAFFKEQQQQIFAIIIAKGKHYQGQKQVASYGSKK